MAEEKVLEFGGMNLDEYANTGALLRHFERQVLRALGIPVERWDAAQKAWGAAIKKNDAGALQRWHAAFDTAWQRVSAENPTLERLKFRAAGGSFEQAPPLELPTYLAQKSEPKIEAIDSTPFADSPTSSGAPVKLAEAQPAAVSPQMSGTVTLSAADEEKIRKLTLPFDKAKTSTRTSDPGVEAPAPVSHRPPLPAAAAPVLTLQQYASLRVELSLNPEQRATTLSRYGVLSDAALTDVDTHFAAVFGADPQLKQQFADYCAQYRAWLASRR